MQMGFDCKLVNDMLTVKSWLFVCKFYTAFNEH
jgi:hypothetical protein